MALAFAALYPLCFWIVGDDPVKNNFHKFHIGLPNAVGGAVLVAVWLMDAPLSLKIIVTAWKAVFLSVSGYSWKKAYPNPGIMSLPSLLGIYAFIRLQAHLVGPGWIVTFIGALSGLILCAAVFAVKLSRWPLTAHGPSGIHLGRAIHVLLFFLGARALWDVYFLLTGGTLYDGFLIMFGLFFGTLFPFISALRVKKFLESNDIRSATGILGLVLCSVLAGDAVCKYYFIKLGIIF